MTRDDFCWQQLGRRQLIHRGTCQHLDVVGNVQNAFRVSLEIGKRLRGVEGFERKLAQLAIDHGSHG
jgi:hypothetical protein